MSNDTDDRLLPGALVGAAGAALIGGTLVGNLLVCLAVALVRKLRRDPGNYLLVSLAFADFSVGVFVMPLALVQLLRTGDWPFGALLCDVWTSADVTLCTASILNLCAISVDRYLTISRPLHAASQHTAARVLSYVAVVWVIAVLVSAGPLVIFRRQPTANVCHVSQNVAYQVYATVCSFYAPTSIIMLVNYKILRAAQRLIRADKAISKSLRHTFIALDKTARSSAPGSLQNCADTHTAQPEAQPNKLLQRLTRVAMRARRQHSGAAAWLPRTHNNKTLKTMAMITGAFIICWLPFFVIALLKPFVCGNRAEPLEPCIPAWLDSLTLWLGYANSLLNPLIYAKYNREFRIPFREMLCCRFGTLQSVLRNEAYAAQLGPPQPAVEAPRPPRHAAKHAKRDSSAF